MCEKPIILVELLFELRMLSFKIVKMTKGLLAKKCARKIVSYYTMFAELREVLVGGRALDKG